MSDKLVTDRRFFYHDLICANFTCCSSFSVENHDGASAHQQHKHQHFQRERWCAKMCYVIVCYGYSVTVISIVLSSGNANGSST